MSSNFPAPQELELRYLRLERSMRADISESHVIVRIAPFALTMLILVLNRVFLESNQVSIRALNGTRNLQLFSESLLFLIPLAVFLGSSERLWMRRFGLIFATAAALADLAFRIQVPGADVNQTLTVTTFMQAIFAPTMIAAFFVVDRTRKFVSRLARLAVFAMLFWVCYGGLFLNNPKAAALAPLFWDLKLSFLWIYLSILLFSDVTTRWELVFNPAHMTRGSIWPDSTVWVESVAELRMVQAHGALNLLLATSLMTARFWIEMKYGFSNMSLPNSVVKILVLRILTDVALFNVLTGLARSFGFRVADATFFVCLAKTPAEFWRRGSTYTYQFVFRYIYLPVYRTTRFQKLALFLAFGFFFLNRVGLDGIVSSLHENRFEFRVALAVFFLYFLSIAVSQRVWFVPKNKMDGAGYAWLSVALTHLTNFSIVVAARFIAEKFP